MFVADLTYGLKVLGGGADAAVVVVDRVHQDRGDLMSLFLRQLGKDLGALPGIT